MNIFLKTIILMQFILLIIFVSCDVGFAEYISGGSTLRFVSGARPIGMGNSYVAISNDINGIFFNPSGLGLITQSEIGATYHQSWFDTSYKFGGYASKFKNKGTFFIGFLVFDGGNLTLKDVETNLNKECKAQVDYVYIVTHAFFLKKNLLFGYNLKLMNSTLIEDIKSSSFAIDMGMLWKFNNNCSVGACLKNLGPNISYTTSSYEIINKNGDPLPVEFKIGFSFESFNNILLSLDIPNILNKINYINFGAEKYLEKSLCLRFGHRFNDSLDLLSFGFGFIGKYCVDYAIRLLRYSEVIQVLSLTIKL